MAASQSTLTSTSWVHSIRTSMTNDPAKHWFDTQVHSHGFEFLDDYLGNILAQAKPQPIIELVKTPSRKKNTAKKTRSAIAAVSKLKSTVPISLDDDDDQAKENVAPVNTFHQALLDAKDRRDAAHLERESRYAQPELASKAEAGGISNLVARGQEQLEDPGAIFDDQVVEDSEEEPLKLPAPHSGSKDLSVIAEGDESTDRRSPQFTVPILQTGQPVSLPAPSLPDLSDQIHPIEDDVTLVTTVAISSSACVIGSVAPEDPEITADHQTKSPSMHTMAPPAVSSSSTMDAQSITAPLPSLQPAQTPSATFKMAIPLHEIPGTGLMRKASAPVLQAFPMATNPTRDHSGSGTLQAPLPKRTSWLVKAKEARDAKAMETNTKGITIFGTGGTNTEQTFLAVPGESGRPKRKSSEMFDAVVTESPTTRQSKVLKVVEDDVQSNASREHQVPAAEIRSVQVLEDDENSGMVDHVKRATEGLGARKGKSMGKSLGGMAAVALAEARATAEARVAEKAKMEAGLPAAPDEELETIPLTDAVEPSNTGFSSIRSRDSDKRLSVSELVITGEILKGKERVFQPPTAGPSRNKSNPRTRVDAGATAAIATDTISPPKARQSKPSLSLLSKPVFQKPPPKVFVPPPQPKATSPKMAATNISSSPSFQKVTPLSAHSSAASLKSDTVFDHDNAPPTWMPTTQDTEYSPAMDYETTTQDQEMGGLNEIEDDDSWHDGDKLGELNHIWTSLAFGPTEKEDEMTWSTIPTQTHTSSTESQSNSNKLNNSQTNLVTTGNGVMNSNETQGNAFGGSEVVDCEMDIDEGELESLELEPGQMTVGLVKKQTDPGARSSFSQQRIASGESSQGGIFHQATKFVTSVLGTSKKGKTPDPVKSIQLAASVAKKQKEEEDKKATRVKEMEIRRQQVAQKKVGEELARELEEERRAKDDADRRKREREELTDKRPLKASTVKKVNDEPPKKLKGETKAGPSQETKEVKQSQFIRATANHPSKSNLRFAAEMPTPVHAAPKPGTVIATPAKGKGKAVVADQDDSKPSRIIQGHMAARARAQLHPTPPVKSESIQLPEIDSEYSDSEDEDRKKNFNPPEWAQSPNLHDALHTLSTVNPDNIFGAVQPLHIEDMFKSRHSRFRARTSSANWNGNDGLKPEEEVEYARRMGFNN